MGKPAAADVTVDRCKSPIWTRILAAAKDSRFLTAEAVRNDKSFGMREDSQVEIETRIKKMSFRIGLQAR